MFECEDPIRRGCCSAQTHSRQTPAGPLTYLEIGRPRQNGKKTPEPNDKRAWLLVLTAKGKKVKSAGQQINYAFEEQWKKKLGEKDYNQLRQLLMKLCE